MNVWGRSGGFKTTSFIIVKINSFKRKTALKIPPAPFDNPCTFTVQGIGPKSIFIRRRKVDGVRGRIGKSLYLVIANLHPSISEQKIKFLFLFRKCFDKGGCQRSLRQKRQCTNLTVSIDIDICMKARRARDHLEQQLSQVLLLCRHFFLQVHVSYFGMLLSDFV